VDMRPTPGDRPSDAEVSPGQLLRQSWGLLTQMRGVFGLLVILAVASLAGSIFPQGQEPDFYISEYGPLLGRVVLFVGLHHVFTTLWYILLIGLLMLSLLGCSRRLWLLACHRCGLLDAEGAKRRFESSEPPVQQRVALSAEGVVHRLFATAHRHKHAIHVAGESEGMRWLHLFRHRWASWGIVLAHYSLLVVGLGAVMGSVPGTSIDTYVVAPEGQEATDAEGRLPFNIRLDRFELRIDEATGAVENYYSDIAIFEEGHQAHAETVFVNRPLRYRHYYITQSSWGLSAARVQITKDGETYEALFRLTRVGEAQMGTDATPKGWQFDREAAAVVLPDEKLAVVARQFVADAARIDGELRERPSGLVVNPAIGLAVVYDFGEDRHNFKELGFLLPGETAELPHGGQVEFTGVVFWSGLGVRKDLGVPLVWIGFIGCIIGMMMVFYVRPSHVIVRLTREGEATTDVAIALPGVSGDDPNGWAELSRELLEQIAPAGPSDEDDSPDDREAQ